MKAKCTVLFCEEDAAKNAATARGLKGSMYKVQLLRWSCPRVGKPTYELRHLLRFQSDLQYDHRNLLKGTTREAAIRHAVKVADSVKCEYEGALQRGRA